jgi:hypothetical protein
VGTSVVTDSKTLEDPNLGSGPRFHVPLRQAPEDTQLDGKRVLLARNGWSALDDLVRNQNRTIEENVRMLAGQQHSIFHPALGKFLDVSEWMSADERSYRSRPVFNRLMPWFIVTHARMTENQPIVTFVPGPDRADAELAELLDIAYKSLWFEANMEDVHDRLMGWVCVGGRGHLLSRIDQHRGPMRPWVGEGMLPVVDAYDQPVPDGEGGALSQFVEEGVPYDKSGQPLAKWRMTAPGAGELVPTGEPHAEPVGTVRCDVLSPMQVRGSWGPQPWHEKRRHYIRSYHSPEELYDAFQQEVEPDTRGGQVSDVGELERLLFGTGFYGAVNGIGESQMSQQVNTDGYVEVTQMWEAPCSYGGMEKTEESPGGRWLVVTRNRVLHDGVRPAAFPYTSPLNTFEFIRVPGRPGGTTPQETLNPVQRQLNDGHGRVRDHVALTTNPKALIDAKAGIAKGKWTNKPGENHYINARPGVEAVKYVVPPPLGIDVYKILEILAQEFHDLGFMAGANDPGTPGDSGEKVKEVRFNTDRFLGPTMRRTAGEYGRVFENWQALLPLVWDMETVISYAGDDNVARTIVAYPEMFKAGKINVRPDVESMLPEGRGEKQQKAFAMYLNGMFGLPGTPQAISKFWEIAHMPHMSRFAKPGGIDNTTAEQENGQLLQGTPAQQIPVWEWYDDAVHLTIHERFMKSPEFKNLDPAIMEQFALHRQAHMFQMQVKLTKQVMQQAAIQNALQPPPTEGGPPGEGGKPGEPAKPETSKKGPPQHPVRPGPPDAPRGPIPGGTVPTAAGAPPPPGF